MRILTKGHPVSGVITLQQSTFVKYNSCSANSHWSFLNIMLCMLYYICEIWDANLSRVASQTNHCQPSVTAKFGLCQYFYIVWYWRYILGRCLKTVSHARKSVIWIWRFGCQQDPQVGPVVVSCCRRSSRVDARTLELLRLRVLLQLQLPSFKKADLSKDVVVQTSALRPLRWSSAVSESISQVSS